MLLHLLLPSHPIFVSKTRKVAYSLRTPYPFKHDVSYTNNNFLRFFSPLHHAFHQWDWNIEISHPISPSIIHSKYFPVSDWLKPQAQFTITSCCWPNLKRLKPNWTEVVKSSARCRYWTVGCENLGTRMCYFWWAEKQTARFLPYEFENILNKQQSIIEFGFRRIWRILQIS